ncbi:son of sevenless, partial [Tremellales sp. Uapishka_1]
MTHAPPTPTSPTIRVAPIPQPTHVQAIHDFHPSLLASTSASSNAGTYLSFKAGDIIRVHTRDASGWWDGEFSGSARSVADSEGSREGAERGPRRGWFPSNYVREMGWDGSLHRRTESTNSTSNSPRSSLRRTSDSHSRQASITSHHSRASTSGSLAYPTSPANYLASLSIPLQSLLHPIVQSLSLLESAIHSNRKPHIQPSTACVISAIRSALSQTDCLSKESSCLVTYPVLSKERKVVLVELSRLVACARTASGAADASTAMVDDEKEMEALAKAARGVFSSVKRFLHLANDCGVEVTLEVDGPATPVSGLPSGPHTSRVKTPPAPNTRMQEAFRMKAASIGDLRAARRRASSPPPPMPTSSGLIATHARTSRARSPSLNTPTSATFAPSVGSGRSSPMSATSAYAKRGMSSGSSHSRNASSDTNGSIWDETPMAPTSLAFILTRQLGSAAEVHEAIGAAEDALLSVIAAFIGHVHSHNIESHPSSHAHLIELTRETIDSVRELLTIVEAVGRHVGIRAARPKEMENLRIAKDHLYEVASKLVEGSEKVANAPFAERGEESYDLEKSRLLQTATGTLRTGTECVRLVRGCVPEDHIPELDGTPKQESKVQTYHGTPIPTIEGAVLRDRVVGVRGVHTLSGLHRKVSSLSRLHKRYQEDGSLLHPMEATDDDEEDEGDQEVVRDLKDDEDLTLKHKVFSSLTRPPLQHNHTSPGLLPQSAGPLRTTFLEPSAMSFTLGSRSRSSSLSSPAPPARIQHRSPSRSADLDKFTGDYEEISQSTRPGHVKRASYSTTSTTSTTAPTEASTRPSTISVQQTPLPTTPHAGHESPILSYLKTEVPSLGSFSKLANLQLDVESTPMPSRPNAPVRSQTTPIPSVNVDVRFWVVAHDYDPREITFNSDGVMVGASLSVLVEKMTPHDATVDPTFWTTFFLTFRSFTTPTTMLEAVVQRYDLQPPQAMTFGPREQAIWIERKVVPVRLRIYNFLKAWLEGFWKSEDDAVLEYMMTFARDIMGSTLPAMAPRLMDAIQRRMDAPFSSGVIASEKSASMDRERSRSVSAPLALGSVGLPPTPIITKSLHSHLRNPSANINITDFDTLELARQFTIMESKLFGAIIPDDLLQSGKRSIRELKALSTLSNQVTGWVADNILNEQDAKRRAALVKFYIKLADKCLGMNNFSTLFAVLAGLNNSTILRLKKTWDALSTKYKLTMERLNEVIVHTKNHQNYRNRLRDVSGPCLPFMGLVLSDITFTADGNPSKRPSVLAPGLDLINFDKYCKLAKIALDFKRFQIPFNFVELVDVQAFLHRVLTERGSGSLDALYRKSLMLEPRQGSERMSTLVEKPGWLGGRI